MLQGPTVDSLPVREDDSVLLDGMLQSWALGYDKYRSVIDQFAFFANDASRVAVEPVSSFDWTANPPYIKLPSALGIVLATLLNLGSFPLFYLGRFFNLLMFAALAISPFALPCWQERHDGCRASSHDAASGVFLFVRCRNHGFGLPVDGYVLASRVRRGPYEPKGKGGDRCRCGSACSVQGGVHGHRASRHPDTEKAVLLGCRFCAVQGVVAIGFALLSLLVFRAAGLLQMAGVASSSTAEGSRGDEYGTFYSLSGLVSDPLNTVLLFLQNVRPEGSFYLDTLVGGSLAWFQVDLKAPLYITVALLFIVVLSAQRSEGDNVVIPGAHRVLCGGLALAGGLGVILSMLIGWTFTSESVVQGVQGRYFLPLLPMAALAMRSKHMSIDIPLRHGVRLYHDRCQRDVPCSHLLRCRGGVATG